MPVCPQNGINYRQSRKIDVHGVIPKDSKHLTPVDNFALPQVSIEGKARYAQLLTVTNNIFYHKHKGTDLSKRRSLRHIVASLGLIGLTTKTLAQESRVKVTKASKVKEKKSCTVSPPGSGSVKNFNNNCTSCHLCVSACPSGVLQPSVLQYGMAGINQPFMDYKANYCQYECVRCSEVCPTGAILKMGLQEKKTTQIGKVYLEWNNCVVNIENTACGSCSEHCPTQAVHMVEHNGKLTKPEIDPDLCIGCGACEYACPTKPYKAIYVNGNPVHLTAKIPEAKALEVEMQDDFPF
ncbi:MAG: 4Fe-4S dicluster domain-containing protein [Bacteroidales bacterium]|nr:4Fe-4S dicluster domain-containing protein [Bacteroidales bacterium]